MCGMGITDRLSHAFRGQQSNPQPRNYRIIADLAEKIDNAYRINNDGDQFLPCDQLATFFTQKIVADALKDAGVHHAKGLAKFIFKDAKKLFLILVMMSSIETEKLSFLSYLERSNITDKSLPIRFINGEGVPLEWASAEASDETKHAVYGSWTRPDRDLLLRYQWYFLAPVFDGHTFRFHFDKKQILPYLTYAPKPTSSGFFGEVSRAEIHPAHVPPWLAVSCTWPHPCPYSPTHFS